MTTNTTQKAPGACDSKGLHSDTNAADFRTGDAIGQGPDSKARHNLIALFALKGHAVHDTDTGGYIVVRSDWGLSRHCAGFSELVAAARQMGVQQ
jgi:hypothetical protein